MTEQPPYEKQLDDLRRYKGFGGAKRIPGDVAAADRFVRGAYFLKYLPEPRNDAEAVAYLWGLISALSAPHGAPQADPGPEGAQATRWTTVIDLTNLRYYFHSTSAPSLVWVKLKDLDFTEGGPVKKLDPQNPTLAGDVSKQFEQAERNRSGSTEVREAPGEFSDK